MSNSVVEILNLLYLYAEKFDGGDLEGAAALFRHATIKVTNTEDFLDEPGMLELWKRYVKIYPCGTPRTKHVITNPITEADDQTGKATVRSYYTVFQAVEGLPLQPVVAGRYHDKFERMDGVWRFSHRNYSLMDLIGDVSFHLKTRVTC